MVHKSEPIFAGCAEIAARRYPKTGFRKTQQPPPSFRRTSMSGRSDRHKQSIRLSGGLHFPSNRMTEPPYPGMPWNQSNPARVLDQHRDIALGPAEAYRMFRRL